MRNKFINISTVCCQDAEGGELEKRGWHAQSARVNPTIHLKIIVEYRYFYCWSDLTLKPFYQAFEQCVLIVFKFASQLDELIR